jgi:hypothetical protein
VSRSDTPLTYIHVGKRETPARHHTRKQEYIHTHIRQAERKRTRKRGKKRRGKGRRSAQVSSSFPPPPLREAVVVRVHAAVLQLDTLAIPVRRHWFQGCLRLRQLRQVLLDDVKRSAKAVLVLR